MGILFLFRSATALESIAARRSFALARVSPLRTAIPLAVFVALAGCTVGTPQPSFGAAPSPSVVADGCALFNRLEGMMPAAVALLVDMSGPEAALVRTAEGVVAAGCRAAGQAQIVSLLSGIEAALPQARARQARRLRRL
jgi:hypothetical protein